MVISHSHSLSHSHSWYMVWWEVRTCIIVWHSEADHIVGGETFHPDVLIYLVLFDILMFWFSLSVVKLSILIFHLSCFIWYSYVLIFIVGGETFHPDFFIYLVLFDINMFWFSSSAVKLSILIFLSIFFYLIFLCFDFHRQWWNFPP